MTSEANVLAAMLLSMPKRYELRDQVGAGGMALVYRARDTVTDDIVALKIIRPQLALDPGTVALFKREAEFSLKLTHRNIVRVRDWVPLVHGGAMVMDFVHGTLLKQQLRTHGAMPFARAIAILTDVASALEYAHFGGLLHRDIKPENIFIEQRTGRALLADFGIAQPAGVAVTDEDSTHGTPSYMSPEHIDGRPMDGRSDLYSLGCVAYEMLTGAPPWAGLTIGEILERQRRDRVPPIHDVRRDIPAWLEGVVARAVAKDPADRWADVKSFSAALNGSGASVAQAQPAIPTQTLLGILFTIVGVLAILLVTDRAPEVGTDIDARRPTFVDTSERIQRDVRLPSRSPGSPSGGASSSPPAPAPIYPDDAVANRILTRAQGLRGNPEGWEMIPQLQRYMNSARVKGATQRQIQEEIRYHRSLCISAREIDSSLSCGD